MPFGESDWWVLIPLREVVLFSVSSGQQELYMKIERIYSTYSLGLTVTDQARSELCLLEKQPVPWSNSTNIRVGLVCERVQDPHCLESGRGRRAIPGQQIHALSLSSAISLEPEAEASD